jgi:hypothetical protein
MRTLEGNVGLIARPPNSGREPIDDLRSAKKSNLMVDSRVSIKIGSDLPPLFAAREFNLARNPMFRVGQQQRILALGLAARRMNPPKNRERVHEAGWTSVAVSGVNTLPDRPPPPVPVELFCEPRVEALAAER